MATTFKNALSPAIGTTPTIVYTAASNVKVTVIGISLANMTGSYITASITVTDPGPGGTFTGNLTNGSPTITNVSNFLNISILSLSFVGYGAFKLKFWFEIFCSSFTKYFYKFIIFPSLGWHFFLTV